MLPTTAVAYPCCSVCTPSGQEREESEIEPGRFGGQSAAAACWCVAERDPETNFSLTAVLLSVCVHCLL